MSDHSSDVDVGKICSALEVDYYECHVCWSRQMFGPDSSSSLTIEELRSITEFEAKFAIVKEGRDKDSIALELSDTRELFSKSLVANRSLRSGDTLRRCDIGYKKPGGGMDLGNIDKIVGKRLKVNLVKDELITMDCLDD